MLTSYESQQPTESGQHEIEKTPSLCRKKRRFDSPMQAELKGTNWNSLYQYEEGKHEIRYFAEMERYNSSLTQSTSEDWLQSEETISNAVGTRTFLSSLVRDVDGASQFVMQEEADCTMNSDIDMDPSVQPQNVNDFKSLSGNVSRKVVFKCDKATSDIQEAMRVEATMINSSVKKKIGIITK